MNQPTPLKKYVLTFPKDDGGQDMKYRFMLTIDRRMSLKVGNGTDEDYGLRLLKSLSAIDGIEAIVPQGGRYTVEVGIARTFDPNEVIKEIERRLNDEILTTIVRPTLVTP